VHRPRVVAGVGALLLALVVVTAELAPGTSSGFNAGITNSTDTVGTAPNFTASAGALPFTDDWANGDAGWNTYNGTWTAANATSGPTYTESTAGAGGPKAVSGQTTWGDYTLQGDVRINSGTQAGLLFRVTSPTAGNDALNGYYLGLYTTGSIVLGRQNNNYTALKTTALPALAPGANTWYHLTVQAVGCVFTYTAQPLDQVGIGTVTSGTYTDTNCPTSGAIGVREFGSGASFRNITATSGGTTSSTPAPYLSQFGAMGLTSPSTSGWTTYGGSWATSTANETYSDSTGTAGDRAVTTAPSTNYSLTGDVLMTTAPTGATGAGFLVRAGGTASGLNAVTGYYVGLNSTNLSITRISSGVATVLDTDALPAALGAGTWYHVTVEVVACQITATAISKAGGQWTRSTFTDTGCTQAPGQIGLRSLGTPASWRAIAATPR
jgi:hypothetical protein